MTPGQYATLRTKEAEDALRNLMALICVSFPHLRGSIDSIGAAWDRRLDALDAYCAMQNAATNTNQPEGEKGGAA